MSYGLEWMMEVVCKLKSNCRLSESIMGLKDWLRKLLASTPWLCADMSNYTAIDITHVQESRWKETVDFLHIQCFTPMARVPEDDTTTLHYLIYLSLASSDWNNTIGFSLISDLSSFDGFTLTFSLKSFLMSCWFFFYPSKSFLVDSFLSQ